MKILHEEDEIVIASYPNQMHALGLSCVLSSLTSLYGQDRLFLYTERMRGYIEKDTLAFVHMRGNKDAPVSVPVGYIAWAYLSKPAEIIFKERFRPLTAQELRSGPNLWMMEICAPMGAADKLMEFLGRAHPTHKDYQATRVKDGKVRPVTYKNRFYASKEA